MHKPPNEVNAQQSTVATFTSQVEQTEITPFVISSKPNKNPTAAESATEVGKNDLIIADNVKNSAISPPTVSEAAMHEATISPNGVCFSQKLTFFASADRYVSPFATVASTFATSSIMIAFALLSIFAPIVAIKNIGVGLLQKDEALVAAVESDELSAINFAPIG